MSVKQKSDQDEDVKKAKYPKAVFYILGNEFCERFCYYGMRTVLYLYLTEELLYSDSKATVIFHSFIMLSYFTPVFGAIMADSWLGKFKTILYLSIVYAIGNIILSAGSVPTGMSTMKAVSLIGLFIISVGTGGIKPCVSAFGGDQFEASQEKERQKFFSIFYFAINSGSVLSTIATPMLRADVHCLGNDSCYPLAYGVPAVLMLVALLLFLAGKSKYKIQPPGEGNLFASVIKCICHALSRKSTNKTKKKSHWLEYADDTFDKDFIQDVKDLLHVLWIFIPLPLFWALFDQTGSSWTAQATKMDGEVLGYQIKPDQMQVMNSIMIIAFIPLFDYVVYPIFNKCNLLKRPLQRIAIGGFLSAVAFVATGLVELNLEREIPVLPGQGFSELTIINNLPCQMNINGTEALLLNAFEAKTLNDVPLGQDLIWKFTPEKCSVKGETSKTFVATSIIESMMITQQGGNLQITKVKDSKKRSDSGEPKIRLFFTIVENFPLNSNISFKLSSETSTYFLTALNDSITDYFEVKPGTYKIYLPINEAAHQSESFGEIKLRAGGVYIVSIYQLNQEKNLAVHEVLKPNSISILYQIPAYVILTAGEIMFSITGLEFSYSQAPKSMKSVVQAAWLLTVAFGNLIVMIIAKLSLFDKKSNELFMFAVLMGLDMLIFSIMAFCYKYVTIKDEESSPKTGCRNKGFENEETDFNK